MKDKYVIDSTSTQLSYARLWVANPKRRPYLGTALNALIPIETEIIETLAVDAWWRLYYNPSYVAGLTTRKLGSVLLHEIEHLLRDHHGRCENGDFDPQLFNEAADIEINDSLEEQPDVELPGKYLRPQDYGFDSHLLAEEYYPLLKRKSESGSEDDLHERRKCGSCAHSGQAPWELGPPSVSSRKTDLGESGSSGGGGGSQSNSGEEDRSPENGTGKNTSNNTDTSLKARGVSRDQAQLIRQSVANSILEHAANLIGQTPLGLQRWAEAFLNPKVAWGTILLGHVRSSLAIQAGMVDYSYRRLSRRHSQSTFIMPTMIKPIVQVAVVIDTSGSMDNNLLSRALRELQGILSSIGGQVPVHVLSVDAASHSVQSIMSIKQLKLFGGGGTDMGSGIVQALKLRPKPSLIVVLTDGYTPWPTNSNSMAGVKVVAVILDKQAPLPPKWIKSLYVD